MNSKTFWLLAVLLFISFQSAAAQQTANLRKLGYLSGGSSHRGLNPTAFWQALRDLGYVEGENIRFEYGLAKGKLDRLPSVAAQLVGARVDIIVAVGGTEPAVAAKKATETIPIVFTSVGDPVGAGIVQSLARPGGNITGLSNINAELSGKRLELVREINPKLSRMAVLWNTDYPSLVLAFKESQAAAQALRFQIQSLEARSLKDFESAFQAALDMHADALYIPASQFFNRHRAKLAELAVKSRLLTVHGDRDFVEAGGLISYGASLADLYRRAALYVDKILKGAKPADLPVEQPTKFELLINLKTAKQIGLTIPPNVLAKADKVIR